MIQCPTCQCVIPPKDFNVSTDLAYCQKCDFNHRYSELVSGESLPDISKTQIPKHLQIDDFGDRMIIRYRRLHPILLFLLPFTAIWSGGSLAAIYGSQFWKGQFRLEESLIGIPFVIGSLILFSVCGYLLFGQIRVTLCGLESSVFYGVAPLGWTRPFDLTSIQSVRLKRTSMEVNGERQTGICMMSSGRSEFVFGSTMHEDSKAYVAAVIRKLLNS